MNKIMIALILLLTSLALNAEEGKLYKWLDENGEVVYSDKPMSPDAKEFTPPSVQTTKPIKEKPKTGNKPKEKKPAFVYEDILITQPGMDENIFDNEGKASVTVEVKPSFFSSLGHTINIKLDGETVVSNSSQLTANLDNLDRGTHTLTAEVCDETGKVLKASKGVKFHIHRYFKPQPKPNTPPKTPPALSN